MKESSLKNKAQVLLSCILLVIIWQVIAMKVNNPIYLPTVDVVIYNLVDIIKDKDFLMNLGSSLYRTIISFIIALASAILLGLVSAFSNFFRNMLKPINALSISIPTMVLVVLSLIWFDKDKAPFIVGIFIVFPILYEGVISAIHSIDKNIVQMADIYKVRFVDKFRYIYLKAIKLQIINLLLSTFSLAFKVVIAGEIHGQPQYGIGTVIQYEKMNFNTEAIFAWIIVVAFVSFILDILNKIIIKKNYRWKN